MHRTLATFEAVVCETYAQQRLRIDLIVAHKSLNVAHTPLDAITGVPWQSTYQTVFWRPSKPLSADFPSALQPRRFGSRWRRTFHCARSSTGSSISPPGGASSKPAKDAGPNICFPLELSRCRMSGHREAMNSPCPCRQRPRQSATMCGGRLRPEHQWALIAGSSMPTVRTSVSIFRLRNARISPKWDDPG